MIGIVVVSHSTRLAEGVCELARQVGQDKVALAGAGGTSDPEHPIGTDAFRVMEAVESVYSEDGVLVLMDLGSAVLSAETALELLDRDKRQHVRLCPAPLVEGAVAAVSVAAAGASLSEIEAEARRALAGKEAHFGGCPREESVVADSPGTEQTIVTIPNRLGLHARPAAKLVHLARKFSARITLENLTRADFLSADRGRPARRHPRCHRHRDRSIGEGSRATRRKQFENGRGP
jgi:dihydroxyacetone kinase phosphotransfer subunit